ncbi:HelD family protein [Paenibacillus chitinolyticus]|uniref:HelD family protein n=1 Tax=Paenibacillus chitinolyticus TaxID=79263 RepID=UPI001C460ED7|nr:UvrD-helicase domain-containing protein [Paenibacillus chitinolyticus]MBV6713048.1 UvrD-helicase domain-containing protein [Paenibacillus chitinolyticus]
MDKNQSAYQEEQNRLDAILADVNRRLEELQAVPVYRGQDFTEQALEALRESSRQSLALASDEPYFGRLDFQPENAAGKSALYIGKFGVDDENGGEPHVIDWRAPVASMFYSYTGGDEKAAYESPDGLVEGLVYLKRNLVIRKQILQRVVDTYDRESDLLSGAGGDEFLLYRLGENKDNKLRDIVSTIQAEQDKIIRSAKNAALIIQGVAGSGKTTVALHRLAFLLYQYRDQVKAENMMIFAPNSMFLDYISGVLPELGVGHIRQSTFADWAIELTGISFALENSADESAVWFALGSKRPPLNDDVSGRWKGSVAFRSFLESCFDGYARTCLPQEPFHPWDGKTLPAQTIGVWYNEEYKHLPPAKRRERVVARIKRWITMELDKVWDAKQKKERKTKSTQRLKAYLKGWPELDALSFYKAVFDPKAGAVWMTEELRGRIPEAVAKDTLASFRRKRIRHEDLPALVFIHASLHGIEGSERFDHVVIDEAQDASPFQIAVLDQYTRQHSFTILGDLSQGIHAYRGTQDWAELTSLFGEGETAYFELERSYRSTMEIIRFANHVLSTGVGAGLLAVPVFRSGERVKVLRVEKERESAFLREAVERLLRRNYDTVAVITRTEEDAVRLHAQLGELGLAASRITADQKQYAGGISVVPVYLTKGLEFDAAILTDADPVHYGADAQDAKLLYVGCTRALHDLWVLYDGEPSPLVSVDDPEIVTRDLPGEDSADRRAE